MRYPKSELEAKLSAVLRDRTTEDQYVQEGVKQLRDWLVLHPEGWKLFGPYYPEIQKLLDQYEPDYVPIMDWAPEYPDALALYRYESEALTLLAALMWQSENGEYLAHPDQPFSIDTLDGPKLFQCGVGVVET